MHSISDAEHTHLDSQLSWCEGLHLDDPFEAALLLASIVDLTLERFPRAPINDWYRNRSKCTTLLSANPELLDSLKHAQKSGNFKPIRNHALLKAPQSVSPDQMTPAQKDSLHRSFTEAPYRGSAVRGFLEYLEHNNRRFHDGSIWARYYAKFCSIVQSSGTGKSRLMFELGKQGVVVVYMNVRPIDDLRSYPARDDIPARLLYFIGGTAAYEERCARFFTALFKTLQARLQNYNEELHNCRDWSQIQTKWENDMKDPESVKRKAFFEEVETLFLQLQKVANPLSITDTADSLSQLTISGQTHTEPRQEVTPVAAYDNLLSMFEGWKNFNGKSHKPCIVIAVDEAHELGKIYGAGKIRQSEFLCRAINSYSSADREQRPGLWVVFASTSSHIADFAVPAGIHNSQRVSSSGELLFPPFTELGWNACALPLEDIPAKNAMELKNIIQFGRPIWEMYFNLHAALDELVNSGLDKLLKTSRYRPDDDNQALAVLSQRFCLDVSLGHPQAVAFVTLAVASHLRVCVSSTEDRTWIETSYPSEPFLSHIAATALHGFEGALDTALRHLSEKMRSGMLDRGQEGELFSRLVLLLAKDLYLRMYKDTRKNRPSLTITDDRAPPPPKNQEPLLAESKEALLVEPLYCQAVPVVGFLEFTLKIALPEPARKVFERAYFNWSHWLRMREIIGPVEGEFDSQLWTRRLWTLTAAVQCCHNQPLINFGIPMYFPDENEFSQCFVQYKNREEGSIDALHKIVRSDPSIKCVSPKPWIAILFDVGVKVEAEVTATYPSRTSECQSDGRDGPCLRIYVPGRSRHVFSFLDGHTDLERRLDDIRVEKDMSHAAWRKTRQRLHDQVLVASSSRKQHMQWETNSDATE